MRRISLEDEDTTLSGSLGKIEPIIIKVASGLNTFPTELCLSVLTDIRLPVLKEEDIFQLLYYILGGQYLPIRLAVAVSAWALASQYSWMHEVGIVNSVEQLESLIRDLSRAHGPSVDVRPLKLALA